MRAYDVILKKRYGGELSAEEIGFLVDGCVGGSIPDSQIAAWLMAVCFMGMSARETADLTMAMVRGGETLDLSDIPGVKVDKHSTGGVGDKTTLVLIPLLAAAGVPVVKMSGRSLGHTGGTLDKLESIPGFSTALSADEMIAQVRRIGAVVAGQSKDLVPADKRLYALRDLTATVDCVPLIAASVMSKKIAAGADALVLDVKVGSGAFMKTAEEAEGLARAMVEIGGQVGRRTAAVVTNMEQPLGFAIGNALEVKEAVAALKGEGPDDLTELCRVLGGVCLLLAGRVSSREEGGRVIDSLIGSGAGLEKLREMVSAQGGDPAVVDDPGVLPSAPVVMSVECPSSGYVARLNAYTVAEAAVSLGAERGAAGIEPDKSVGVVLRKKTGDHVERGEALAEVHAGSEEAARLAAGIVLKAFSFGMGPVKSPVLVRGIIE